MHHMRSGRIHTGYREGGDIGQDVRMERRQQKWGMIRNLRLAV